MLAQLKQTDIPCDNEWKGGIAPDMNMVYKVSVENSTQDQIGMRVNWNHFQFF